MTLSCPKCLVPIRGVPLLDIWLELCSRAGIRDVLLNVSHHSDRVREHLGRRHGGPLVRLVVETEPRGTAGTVADNRSFVDGEESFWIIYADNLTNLALTDMLATHRSHDGLMTIGVFHAPVPSAAGIVEVDGGGRVVSFEEKPPHPRGDLANAGLYIARAGLLAEIPAAREGILDFGFDILPRLAGRIHAHVIEGFYMDIGTPAALAAAAENWPGTGRQVGR